MAQNNPHFNYLTVNNGLSQNSITSIIQDSKGLIWIASYDGLNRFDGFSTIVKRHESKNKNSLTENRILCMTEYKNGNIWIGTDGGGINVYDPGNDNFYHYTVQNGAIPNNTIYCIVSDTSGNMWVGTEKGLLRANLNNNTIIFDYFDDWGIISKLLCDKAGNIWVASEKGLYVIPSTHATTGKTSGAIEITQIQNPYITALFCDHLDNVWIASYNSLFKIKNFKHTNKNIEISNLYDSIFKDARPVIRDIVEDKDNNIWFGTENSGLFKFSVAESGILHNTNYYHTDKPFCNISDNSIRALFVDKTNILWIGFHKRGVNYTDICGKNFHLLHELCLPEMNELGYKSKFVSSFICDSHDNIWIVTESEGVYLYNYKSKQMQYLNNFQGYKSVGSVLETFKKEVWMGGESCLYFITEAYADQKKNLPKRIALESPVGIVRTLCEDSNGDIWFGSLTGKGLYRYNPQKGSFKLYDIENKIPSEKIFYLLAERNMPVIWVGTLDGGLAKIKYSDFENDIETEVYTTEGAHTLNSNHIWNIYKDKSERIWIGTDAGLNKIVCDKSGNILSISSIDIPTLNGIKVMAITEDMDGNLWLNCSQGLYFFNPQTNETQVYTYQDGLQSNTFTEASVITKDGWIYAGGINGVNYFHPSQIKQNPYKSDVAIVNLRIHGKIIRPGEVFGNKQVLDQDINQTKELVLDYKNNSFMFEFVGIHYAIPNKNQFQFKLEGFDENWVHTTSALRIAAYSNLPPGNYTFKIKASNNDGVWSNNIKEVKITILPPPWKTVWAYILYMLAILSLSYFIIHYLLTKQRFKNELYLERVEKEKMQELNEMKMRFFTNITHEFRTPLMLIISPLRDLMSDIRKQNNHVQLRLQIISRNAQRLLGLINQTLDLRKISSDTMSLLITRNSLHVQVENMIDSFELLAIDRDVTIRFENELPTDIQWYDKYKIDKVLFNIISNAFKYTPKKGIIDIHIHQMDDNDGIEYAIVSIKDTGKGIPASELDKIFEMFYQAKNSTIEGTGIGLSYVKSLLNIHKGDIYVESKEGQGTCFTFKFSVSKEAYSEEQINDTINPDYDNQFILPIIDDSVNNEITVSEEIYTVERNQNGDKGKTILLVEDNIDLRMYIKDCLIKYYNIIETSDGVAGLKSAKKHQPDLIISDIMMPFMDGIELCKTLKADIHTRHIPIFLHSIKSDEITLKEAMEAGAEDLIYKPYNYLVLIKKIRNFFRTREHLVSRTQAEIILEPAEVNIPSSDEELMLRVSKIIEENLSNPEFGVEILAEMLNMSRMQLHRRIVMITGMQTSSLIRDFRLQRASQLLKSGEKRISEVMWETGFNNHTRFNKYFKKKYGLNVKDYIRKTDNH
ncbi:hybrid sensor histidine kinase/response regulator transcription factor [Dysgonomonas reticulitermitis]